MISKPTKRKVKTKAKRKNPKTWMDDFNGKNIKLFFKGLRAKGFIEGKLWEEKGSYVIENNYSSITFKASDLLNIGYDEENILVGTLII